LNDNGATLSDYKIEASSDGGSKWTTINHTAFVGEGFAVTGLKAGTSYKFRVSAINSLGQGELSNVASVTTLGLAPAAPTALKATTKTTTTVTLSWSAAKVTGGSAVREYIVQYSKDKGASWIRVSAASFNSLSIVVKGFKPKTTYLFRVSARNDVGVSSTSNVVVVGTR
jgi:titin